MKGLRIEFTIGTEVGEMSHPLHLDGLLAYAATQANNGDWRNVAIPLEMENGVHKASALHFERSNVRLFSRVQRTEQSIIIDGIGTYATIGKAKNQFSLSNNQFKTSILSTPVFSSTRAIAYCVGRKNEVESLLRRITTLGPYGKLGMGQVLSVKVLEDESAHERWIERVLPWCPSEEDYYPIQSTYTFPYWMMKNMTQGWIHKSVA